MADDLGVTIPDRLRLDPLEELWAIPLGPDPQAPPLVRPRPVSGPRAALESVALSALRRPPCVVSFSGGVDSSVVLALATHVARREGLPMPIPVTNCFPGVAEANEAEWQERVIRHLDLDEWTRLEWSDELDILGPFATTVLRRHGIVAPFNSHFHYPLLERARGGSLLSGIGGDELFESVSRARAAKVLLQHRRPRLDELDSVLFALAPRRLRALAKTRIRRNPFDRYRWIRPEYMRRLARTHSDWESRDPLRNDRALREWWWPSRIVQCNLASKRALAGDFDVVMDNPFVDPLVLTECAESGGAVGLGRGSRVRGFETLVGDLLPREILRRPSKGSFDGAFWNRHARAFVAGWEGDGLDTGQVNVDALKAEWLRPVPDPHSFVQLQRAWVASKL